MISIEIIEGCNFKCYFCDAKTIPSNKYMPYELFVKIVDGVVAAGFDKIKLTPSKGEPFLHPAIYQMLTYASDRCKQVTITTNVSAINVAKLIECGCDNLLLNVSIYGETKSEFEKLTMVDGRLFDIVHERLHQLDDAGIRYVIGNRTENYNFVYNGNDSHSPNFNASKKCVFHQYPKFNVDGRITFCNFSTSEICDDGSLLFGDASATPVASLLSHPLRYAFYNRQDLCEQYCKEHSRNCGFVPTVSAFKWLTKSKQAYAADPSAADIEYAKMVDNVRASYDNDKD